MIESSHSDPGSQVAGLLLRCHQIQKELAAAAGLSVDEFHCLTQLYIQAPCCVKTLRELLGVSPTRASRLLHGLEMHGYLTRSLEFDDKRRERLALTSKGQALAQSLLRSSALCSLKLFYALPEDFRPRRRVQHTPEDS